MITEASELLAVAGSLYDAVLNPGLWAMALRRLSQSFGALGMVICVLDIKSHAILFQFAFPPIPEEDAQTACGELPALEALEIPLSDVVDLLPGGQALRYTFASPLEKDAAGAEYFVARLWLPPAEEIADLPGGARGIAPRQEAVLSRWRVLEPHIVRALRMLRGLDQVELRASTVDVTEAFGCGMLLLNGRGRVRHMNRIAEAHLSLGTGLVVTTDGSLATARECDKQALSDLIHRALAARPAAGSMALQRPESPRPYVLQALPLTLKRRGTGPARRAAALLIREPSTGVHTARADLRQLFGLTGQEAKLASRIVLGERLAEAAKHLGVTAKTARSYLEVIFRKTGTRRQAELVALVQSITFR